MQNLILPDGTVSTQRFPVVSDKEMYWQLINSPRIVELLDKPFHGKYIQQTMMSQAQHSETPPELIEQVRSRCLQHIQNVKSETGETELYTEAFEKTWPRMQAEMRKNLGMANAILDLGACESLGFYAALVMIALSDSGSSAAVLETTNNRMFDIAGRHIEVTPDDPIVKICTQYGIFVDMRYRDYLLLPLIAQAQSVLSAGGGLLREIRSHGGLKLEELLAKEFFAVDSDTNLRPKLDAAFEAYYGVKFAETGISYLWCDLAEIFDNPAYRDHFELTYSAGTYSYQTKLAPKDGGYDVVPDDEAALRLIQGLVDVTQPGGTIFLDAQVLTEDKDMGLIAKTFGWKGRPVLYMEPNLNAASNRFVRLLAQVNGVKSFRTIIEPIRQSGIYWLLEKA